MDSIDVKQLRKALEAAGLEIFRTRGDEVHLAERHNLQLMEARVRVRRGVSGAVIVVLHAQRSDAPQTDEAALFALIRDRATALLARGYVEQDAASRGITSVSDPDHLLDTWFEVTFARPVSSIDEAVAEARAAMATTRYVLPPR